MPEIRTEQIGTISLDDHQTHQVYNGLDACVTLEVHEELSKLNMTDSASVMYDFSRALQAPALEMMLRGIRVDNARRWDFIRDLEKKEEKVQEILDEFAAAVWGIGLNPRSPKQLKTFFYEKMGYDPIFKYSKGEKKISTDREALEKLSVYIHAEPIINCILKIRELRKKSSILRSEVDEDRPGFFRMRTSYNIVGTETNRWSSSKNVEGGGTNLQNLTEELRRVFIADEGKKFAYVDLSQAESRALGFLCWVLFGSHSYLDACESGDLHTSVCQLVWRDLGWTGDLKKDKDIAESPFYRHFSYRDMAKRGGHGSNYYGQPFTIARNLKVTQKLIEDFQRDYFEAFPEIREYHKYCSKMLSTSGEIFTPLGTGRVFFGRHNDDATLREAIAHVPQHMVGVLLNLALWRVWYYLGREVDILGQVHDAILIQYPEEKEEEVLSAVIPLMATPLTHNGRTTIIPSDIMVGWNWSKYYDEKMAKADEQKGRKPKPLNLDGLRGRRLGEEDSRKRSELPSLLQLDRLVA